MDIKKLDITFVLTKSKRRRFIFKYILSICNIYGTTISMVHANICVRNRHGNIYSLWTLKNWIIHQFIFLKGIICFHVGMYVMYLWIGDFMIFFFNLCIEIIIKGINNVRT